MSDWASAVECGPDTCRPTAWITFILSLKTPQPLGSTHTPVCKAANKGKINNCLSRSCDLDTFPVAALDVAATALQGIFEIFDVVFFNWNGYRRLTHFHTHIRILLRFPV